MGISTMYIVQLVASVTEDGGFGPRVMGVLASGKESQAPLPLLVSYLWLQVLLWPGDKSCMHPLLLQPALLDPCGQMLQHGS